jgi:hypothetical protein
MQKLANFHIRLFSVIIMAIQMSGDAVDRLFRVNLLSLPHIVSIHELSVQ